MKSIIKSIIIFATLVGFTGCELDIFNTKELEMLKEENRKLQLVKLKMEANRSLVIDEKQLLYQNRENLAKIEMQRDVARLNQEKELQRLQLQNILEKERLAMEQKNAEAQLALNAKLAVAKDSQEFKLYLIALVALLLSIIAFFLFYYYRKKREDKLRAYNDNLDKYFRAKENEARVEIAEKILNTLSSGNLSTGHQARLIEVFTADTKDDFQDDALLEDNSKDDGVEDAIIVTQSGE